MNRPTIEDREFGRGRRYDSSSSRESSPRRPQKRSFSPASDGDVEVAPAENDDTPPPADRSLLRQPLAFGPSVLGTSSALIETYKPEPLPKRIGRPKKNPFLRTDTGDHSSQFKTTQKSTKKRRINDYNGQTNRFRLNKDKQGSIPVSVQAYHPTSSQPHGAYESYFVASVSPTPTLSSSYYPSSSTAASSVSPQFTPTNILPPALQQLPPTLPSGLQISKERGSYYTNVPASNEHYTQSSTTSTTSQPTPDLPPHTRLSPPPGRSGKYYRRDYEKEREIARMPSSSASISKRDNFRDQNSRSSEKSPAKLEKPEGVNKSQTGSRQPVRMVTLLIEDRRYGMADHQLTEVKIPLRPLADQADGFWADAKMLSEQLQAGPSRIDGPAKVYTFRGKYRQIFLRVSADNVDEFTTMNIIVKPDRTLECYVEAIPAPGVPPVPYNPPDVRMSSSPESRASSQTSSLGRNSRKERTQDRLPPVSELSRMIRDSAEVAKHMPNYQLEAGRAASPYSAVDSFSPSDDEGKSDGERISNYMVQQVEMEIYEDSEWHGFFRAKANKLPHRICDTLVQFRFVKKCWDRLVGTILQSTQLPVEKIHIVQALKIDDPDFLRVCTDTMALLDLYGPKGKRYEDKKVLEMIVDQSEPGYGSNPIKRLLHWMQDLDKEWRAEHLDP